MNELDGTILGAIKAKPGIKATEIATQLKIDKKDVNSALYGKLRTKVKQDKSYRWYPNDVANIEVRDKGPKKLDTPLAKLSSYYLDCLSHDDLGGVSEFAESKYGDPNYVEIDDLPFFNEENSDPLESESGRRLLGRIRRDRNRKTLYLGYPARLNLIRSKKGWEGFLVEPIFLFPFQDADNKYARPTLSEELPQFNLRALKSLANAGDTSLMEEAIQIAEELGLGNSAADMPDLDELFARLYEIRPEWDWQEAIDPYDLSNGEPLSNLNKQGIYNRAILISADRSPFTKGLETELGQLQGVAKSKYKDTALSAWLGGQTIDSPPADQRPLLEVLPLNNEQRQAVRQALTNPLTVITGPPGTGKSQVVTSILANAAWKGETVLFTSKNNKAVDVVEIRANSLGPRPVLLRLGANQYQSRLAQYLITLLAATTTEDDHALYREEEEAYAKLKDQSEALEKSLQQLISLRNKVDKLSRQVDILREEIGEELFSGLIEYDYDEESGELFNAISEANRDDQSGFIRFIWPLIRENRFGRLEEYGEAYAEIGDFIGLPVPDGHIDTSSFEEWIEYSIALDQRLQQIEVVLEYHQKLETLSNSQSLEDLSAQWSLLTQKLTSNSEILWKTWLQLQPSRMSAEQRKTLGNYNSLLQMLVAANEDNQRVGRDVFRKYYQLFPKITSIFSCWAITSLSARGRLPFEPAFFDLLVIDEASQCDIASVLPLLFRSRRVVVIGDPMQLRHISTLSKKQDQQILSKHELLEDYPGWAYSTTSLFDLASGRCRGEDIVVLRDHHRSHADIIEFSNEEFYNGRLRVATSYDRLRLLKSGEPAVRWVNVKGKVVRPGAGGALNEKEAQAVVQEIQRLVAQAYDGTLGVVSPFRAQANRIRDLVYMDDSLASRLGEMEFLSDTVHKFQGDERDIMLFSPVVASGITTGSLGFLQSNPNLFNVAITRARAALIIVGDKSAALNCSVDYLAKFAEYVGKLKRSKATDPILNADDLGHEYPVVSNPEQVSDWERSFYSSLYQAGIRPIPQYAVEKYKLDFAVMEGERRLNIEVDGERYHRNWDGELCRRDIIRNQRMIELGWDVMRFWVYQIRDDLDYCINKVAAWHQEK